jgi:hypothetical protein
MALSNKTSLLSQLKRTPGMDAASKAEAAKINQSLLDSVMCSTYSDAVNTVSGSNVVDIPIIQPANTVLEDLIVICTAASAHEEGTLSFTAGNAAHSGEQIVAFTSKSLTDLGTSTAVGQGASIHTKVTTALQGGASHTIVAGAGYTSTDRTIFTRVSSSALSPAGFQNNNGAFRVVAKYYNL